MSGLLDRAGMAAAVGLKLGTFWSKVLAYNAAAEAEGRPGLQPDAVEDHKNFKKFFYKPDRAGEFLAAVNTVTAAPKGRPKKGATPS